MICTKCRLHGEIEQIKNILLDNGYTKKSSTLRLPRKLLSSPPLSVLAKKCPLYLRVPWVGKPSTNLEKQIKTAVESCHGSVSTHLVFISKWMLTVTCKDVLPTTQKISVRYEYKCHCNSWYKGQTSQRPQGPIKQHVLQWFR